MKCNRCCEACEKEIVGLLLRNGADGRMHPVTKYSPLYIACYNGHKDIAEMLIFKFPELIRQWTVEKWLPAHAACIGGHVAVLDLLLGFNYPQHLLVKYWSVFILDEVFIIIFEEYLNDIPNCCLSVILVESGSMRWLLT